mmetsp:Transcript_18296/g.25789  ORF Transcript_18296/g.25789 Transcript_18296/m.25789 type:complete len:316 (-) Transcript_18296:165-1112(-)
MKTLVLLTTVIMTTSSISTTRALSSSSSTPATEKPKWSQKAEDLAKQLTKTQLDRLREAGAMDVKRPVKIRAQRLDIESPPEEWMKDNDKGPEEGGVSKIIHFQRHGQGYHNLLGEVWRDLGYQIDLDNPDPAQNPFVRDEILDSPLTQLGRDECSARRQEASMLNPELVIVSPLHRAIQTAQLSFRDFYGCEEVPWVAHEGIREEIGLLICNKRRSISEAKLEFPKIDFSHIEHDEDELWNPTEREVATSKSDRAYNFLVDFVQSRPEQEIAVVSHSAFLFNMLNTVMDCGDDEELKRWFKTSEIRSMRVTFEG